MTRVTIGFVPRERFSFAARSLESILEHTDVPFRLVVVDCGMPTVYRDAVEKLLDGRPNVEIIRADHPLLPNVSKHLVIPRATTEFVCLIENDVLVEPGWLSAMLAAADEEGADVVVPQLWEQGKRGHRLHGVKNIGQLAFHEAADGRHLAMEPLTRDVQDRFQGRRRVTAIETHCVLFRSQVFQCVPLFDEKLCTRENIDLSLALAEAECSIVCEPASVVTFYPPPPIEPDDREIYFTHWDLDLARETCAHIRKKWGLASFPESIEFVQQRLRLAETYQRFLDLRADLASVVPEGSSLIIVDDGVWKPGELAPARTVVPFLEKDGQYWGCPADDATAIREFERLRARGIQYLLFTAPAFWWLNQYPGFLDYLRNMFACVRENQRVVAFDLGREPAAT